LAAVLIFIAGIKWRFIIIGAVIAVSLLTLEVGNEYFKIYPLLKEYQLKRIMVFINPEKDIDNSGWHQYQAELAVGSGGMYGKGYLHGTQSMLGFLPETHTDFIFSVIAEETGFAGALAVIVLYTFLLFSALRAAIFARDDFGLYLAVGIAVIIFTHSVVNIGMSIRLMPVTGLPLPLLSYGGTFIVNTMIYLGILQSIYAHRRKGAEGRLQWRKSSQLID
jgi:rod shape determining protein RodA